MSLIRVENVTFAYPGSYDNIFENVSFQLDTDWKLGFVGRNGRGKTTFLNLLQGKYEYSGSIYSSVVFDCFPYAVEDKTQLTCQVLEQVCPDAQQWQIIRELNLLDVEEDVLWRPFDTLSNGEQTKVLLAALFLNEGHFLLIDEPTNHLDTKARQKVAAYLKRKKGFILVSHDRRFLDQCVDHILSVNRADIQLQKGNFSSWMANFRRQQEAELAQNRRLKKDISRLQQAARRTANWSEKVEASKTGAYDKGYVGHKAEKMMKRSKVLQARQQQAIEEKSSLLKNIETADSLKLTQLTYHSDRLAVFNNVAIDYGNGTVCTDISFDIRHGDRIALDGKNGSGKSSLLKLLAGENIPYSGQLYTGSGLIISYVPQATSHLKGNLKDFATEKNIDETLFKAILRKMDFQRIMFEKDMAEFSAGQKKKVLIAASLCQPAHLYVWDEPLNYIDVYSRMQIEQLLADFAPTMIFVEHDRAFRDAVATKTVSL